MTTTTPAALPNPDAITQAAHMLAAASPKGWTEIKFFMWYTHGDAISSRMWFVVDGKPFSISPPDCEMILHKMRDQQAATGHPRWKRCEITLSRQNEASDAKLKVKFRYIWGRAPSYPRNTTHPNY